MKKRVFSLLAAVMVLVCICSVPASAEELYIFEPLPDVSFMNDSFESTFEEDSLGNITYFYFEGIVPDGLYEFTYFIEVDGVLIELPSLEPVDVRFEYSDGFWLFRDEVVVDSFDLVGLNIPFDFFMYYSGSDSDTVLFLQYDGVDYLLDGAYVQLVPVSSGGIIENLGSVFSAAQRTMQIEFVIYGFTLTWWDVFLWSTIATVVGCLIVRFLHG